MKSSGTHLRLKVSLKSQLTLSFWTSTGVTLIQSELDRTWVTGVVLEPVIGLVGVQRVGNELKAWGEGSPGSSLVTSRL